MKKFVYLILSAVYLNSFNLEVTKFMVDGKLYNLVEIKDKDKIDCKVNIDFDQSKIINCNLNSDKNVSKKFELFSLYVNKKIYFKTKYNYELISFKNQDNYYKNIIFFKNENRVFKKNHDGLGFKIKYEKEHKFYVSVLDDDLKPDMKILDANKLSFIRGLYRKKDFYSVIKTIDRELERGSNFESDLLVLKIETLDKILKNKDREYGYKDIIEVSDKFLKKYPSNSSFTKVMYFKIKSLFKLGKKKLALALAKKLDNNFKDDFYNELSQIEMAKYLANNPTKRVDSYKILRRELYNTKHIPIALKSAYLLTKYALKDKKIIDAKKYIDKIINADPEYLIKNKKESYKLAKGFASLNDFKSAVDIAKILKKKMSDNEEFLKNFAYWKDKAGYKDEAYKEYKRYMKKYPKGQYVNFIHERMQKVLIDVNESNISKKIADIDSVIKKYSNDPVYKKALLKKVEILKENKKYEDILKLGKKLKDINATKYIDLSASELFKRYIDEDDCSKAIDLVDRYKVVIKDFDRLYKLANCYYGLAFYKESSELTLKFLKSHSEDVSKWYYLGIKSYIKLKKYDEALKLFDDFRKIEDVENSRYKNIYYDIFEIYYAKKERDKIFDYVSKIEKLFPKKSKNLDVYYKTIKYLINSKASDLLIIYYAKKLLGLQKELRVNTYSVQVDIYLIRSLIRLGKNREALKYFADAYLDKSKSDAQKAELLYLAGEASLKLNEKKQAKEFFTKCGVSVKNKMWQKLCSESLKLLDDE